MLSTGHYLNFSLLDPLEPLTTTPSITTFVVNPIENSLFFFIKMYPELFYSVPASWHALRILNIIQTTDIMKAISSSSSWWNFSSISPQSHKGNHQIQIPRDLCFSLSSLDCSSSQNHRGSHQSQIRSPTCHTSRTWKCMKYMKI